MAHLNSNEPSPDILVDWHKNAPAIYRFVNLYYDYSSVPKSYGTDTVLNMVEAHTLSAIYENPSFSPSEIAKLMSRSKGAVSQILKKLESKGLIQKTFRPDSNKSVQLILTDKGVNLCIHHADYDRTDERETLQALLDLCSPQDIQAFCRVLTAYNTLF